MIVKCIEPGKYALKINCGIGMLTEKIAKKIMYNEYRRYGMVIKCMN